jgi:plastocyanin
MAARTVATTDTLNTFRTSFNTLSGTDIGDPATLATTAKTIVAAINEINTSVSATGFTMSDGSTTQSVVAGNTVTFAGSSGITATVSATDTLTYSLDASLGSHYFDAFGSKFNADGSNNYTFSGPGFPTTQNDPTLYVHRGFTYAFDNSVNGGAHPFRIQSTQGLSGSAYTTGQTGSGTSVLYWTVPMDAPNTLYYQCTIHSLMNGTINVVN